MIAEMPAIEGHFFDSLSERSLRNDLAEPGRCVLVAAVLELSSQILIDGACGDQGLAGRIVDDLHRDVFVTAIHTQPGPSTGTVLEVFPHAVSPTFPPATQCSLLVHVLPYLVLPVRE